MPPFPSQVVQLPDCQQNWEYLVKHPPVVLEDGAPLPRAAGPRIVAGTVNGATGGVVSGSGFTSVRTAAGTYIVTFAPVFAAVPSVAFGTDTTGGASVALLNGLPTAAVCNVFTLLTATGALADRNFSFIAVGT